MNNFFQQILSLKPPSEETQDDRQGKMLLHTEYSLLTLLRGQQGVIQHHGLYKVCKIFCYYFAVLFSSQFVLILLSHHTRIQ